MRTKYGQAVSDDEICPCFNNNYLTRNISEILVLMTKCFLIRG